MVLANLFRSVSCVLVRRVADFMTQCASRASLRCLEAGWGMKGDRGHWAKLYSSNILATMSLPRGSKDPRPGKRQAPIQSTFKYLLQ